MKSPDKISSLFRLSFTFVALIMPTLGQALPTGLVSRWLADENANDTENLNNGLPQNGATFAPGKIGLAFSFDGLDDVVVIPHSSSLNLASSHTIAAWAFRTSPASGVHLVGKRVGCGFDTNFIQLAIGTNAIPSAAVPLNTWNHLAVTYNGSLALYYVNGVSVASWVVMLGNNTAPLLIGNSGTCAPFAGLIDDVQIYNRPLSQLEIQSIMEPEVSIATQILPQFAFGGGWYSALYFTNTGTSAASFPVSFVGDDGRSLSVPSVGGSSTTVSLTPRGTAVIEASNVGPLNQGYVSLSLPVGVVGYGIFRQNTPRGDQEAVVPLSTMSSRTSTLIWDDTNFVTAVAIVNPSSLDTVCTIVVRDIQGVTIGTATVPLTAKRKVAIALRDLPGLGAMAGRRGSADFTVNNFGNVAVLGLRFGGAAFTSIPTADR